MASEAIFSEAVRHEWHVLVACPSIPLGAGKTSQGLQSKKSLSIWHWFTKGHNRDPSLGTSSYVPIEIRCRVWKEVLVKDGKDCHGWPNTLPDHQSYSDPTKPSYLLFCGKAGKTYQHFGKLCRWSGLSAIVCTYLGNC